MTREEWWKNFGMGREIDAAGSFIYNSILYLNKIPHLSHSVDSFEILYGLSVGIERLQKVAIILLEHKDGDDVEELEESLITHNTIDLSNRIDRLAKQNLSDVHKELLSMLSKFYKTHRYGRYSLKSVPNIDAEKNQLVGYLKKHLKIKIPADEGIWVIRNTDQIRKFIGKIVKKIVSELYGIIRKQAADLGLYTYELRSDSKSIKVFLGERLDFLDEDRVRRELILYLVNMKKNNAYIDFLSSFEYLELDPALTPAYIRLLINDIPQNYNYVVGEIEELYSDVIHDKGERFGELKLIDDENIVQCAVEYELGHDEI